VKCVAPSAWFWGFFHCGGDCTTCAILEHDENVQSAKLFQECSAQQSFRKARALIVLTRVGDPLFCKWIAGCEIFDELRRAQKTEIVPTWEFNLGSAIQFGQAIASPHRYRDGPQFLGCEVLR